MESAAAGFALQPVAVAINPQGLLQIVERPSRLTPGPSDADRSKLMELVTFAAQAPGAPRLIQGPMPAARRAAPSPRAEAPVTDSGSEPRLAAIMESAPRTRWTQLASLGPDAVTGQAILSDIDRPAGWGNGWAAAPAFDEEHPEELSYRPFPVAPLLTASASIDEPALSRMTAPDIAKILAVLDAPGLVPPMSFRPGQLRPIFEKKWHVLEGGQQTQIQQDAECHQQFPSCGQL